MKDFIFHSPTKIIFGKDSVLKIKDEIASRNFKNVLFVYGSDRVEKIGLIDTLVEKSKEAGAKSYFLKGIRPNPNIEEVYKGIKICRDNSIDLIVGVGGGSVIDTAKSIGVGVCYNGDAFDFNRHLAKPNKCLPIGVVLTISSAGSELSNSCVIQNDTLKIKSGFNDDIIRPTFAIEDPTFTFTVSSFQTAVGISDTIMHSLERYLDPSDEFGLSDEFALAVIKKTMQSGEICLQNPDNYDARANLMLCSSLSHNGITSIGKDGIFHVHPIEHGLSGYKSEIVHGAGVALVYPAWAEYVLDQNLNKFAHLTEYIFNKKSESLKETAIIGVRLFREYFSKIGMPSSLKDVGLSKNDIPAIADLITDNGTRVIGRYPKSLDREDIKKILLKLS